MNCGLKIEPPLGIDNEYSLLEILSCDLRSDTILKVRAITRFIFVRMYVLDPRTSDRLSLRFLSSLLAFCTTVVRNDLQINAAHTSYP